MPVIRFIILVWLMISVLWTPLTMAAPLDAETLAKKIEPPYALGEVINDDGVWSLVNLDGKQSGYIFETEYLAPIPGFSGQPVNMLVAMTNEGRLLKVEILHHNEPIFVSGLGEAPFNEFVTQYSGLSITNAMSVGVPYGKGDDAGSQIYLDGVTKATASVRIAHESILAAAYSVIREKQQGISAGPSPKPDLTNTEELTFEDLIEQKLLTRVQVSNADVQEIFQGTEWQDDDDIALEEPDGVYLDLWVIDIGSPSIAKAVLDADSLEALNYFLSISPDDEPILLIDQGRHGLVSDDFVRNTEPDLLEARQGGLPVALRDADLDLTLLPGLPEGHQMVVRVDRRIGFDPTQPWDLILRVIRKHGSFMPTIGSESITVTHQTAKRFYVFPKVEKRLSPEMAAVYGRLPDLVALAGFLLVLASVLLFAMKPLARHRHFRLIRLAILAVVIGFIGWWGQGQLSIVTVLGVVGAAMAQQSMRFLLYDPFSLLIWALVILSFLYWGRGFFCGWLCPYGAMQEFTGYLAEKLGIKQWRIPSKLNRHLRKIKYVVLAVLVVMTIYAPTYLDTMVEVEPFKTAVTTFFVREWYFVLYAVLWLVLGMFVYKGFCRFVCPLGAVMAIGGLLRGKKWIERRKPCGSPCQLCAVRCKYDAIKPSGDIAYDECFQCLDCVTIYEDEKTCVPLVLAAKGKPL